MKVLKGLIALLILIGMPAVVSCGGEHRIVVDFTSGPGLKEGLDVRLGEQSIGRTGVVAVQNGLVSCEVLLKRPDSIPSETVFLIVEESPAQAVLVAFPRGKPVAIERGSNPPRFRGAANRFELAKILGEDEWGRAKQVIDSVIGIVLKKLAE